MSPGKTLQIKIHILCVLWIQDYSVQAAVGFVLETRKGIVTEIDDRASNLKLSILLFL